MFDDVTALCGGEMVWSYDGVTAKWNDDNETRMTTPSVDEERLSLLASYAVWYAAYHGYVSVVVCAVGIVGNIFNVVVLTRPHMASSSTNCVLTALAVSDLLTMIVYVPFAVQFYCRRRPRAVVRANTFGWTAFLLFYVHTSVTAHTVSIWLAVLLSVVRYVYVRPRSTASLRVGGGGSSSGDGGHGRVRCAVVGVYAFAVVILVPNYLSLVMRPSATPDRNGRLIIFAKQVMFSLTLVSFFFVSRITQKLLSFTKFSGKMVHGPRKKTTRF